MFRPFTLAIFRLRNEKKLSKKLYSTYVGYIQPTYVEYSYLLSFFSFLNLKMAIVNCRNM